ncbi:MAG: helix-turn-helix transcriptional regulator [Bacillaceae bacterium]|nr:helix-turn-helix transcriptional regulator [Bacillaceae bacterium]
MLDMKFDIRKIRELRKVKNLSLQELSKRSGVSAGMISQIERGNADPTITTLYKLCKGLDITIGELLLNDVHSDLVVRKSERKIMTLPDSKATYQLLTSGIRTNLEMIMVELEPNQQDRQLISHKGEECGFVLKGSLTVVLGDEEYHLNEGDSITFNSSIPHRFINNGSGTSISIWAMTPPSF